MSVESSVEEEVCKMCLCNLPSQSLIITPSKTLSNPPKPLATSLKPLKAGDNVAVYFNDTCKCKAKGNLEKCKCSETPSLTGPWFWGTISSLPPLDAPVKEVVTGCQRVWVEFDDETGDWLDYPSEGVKLFRRQ